MLRRIAIASTVYLLAGMIAHAAFFLGTGVTQWVHDFYEQDMVETCITVAWAFALNRVPVAIVEGIVVAWVSRTFSWGTLLTLAVLIPFVLEIVLSLPFTLEWFPLGGWHVNLLVGVLGPPATTGAIVGAVSILLWLREERH